ncbi:MAG: M20/M25/M40 family metallo-hydrolase [Gemmatimonadetes bacterium]|nr:M20/M25/M40 family metallo-hydrolase [Gemmatimonadota bacterium]
MTVRCLRGFAALLCGGLHFPRLAGRSALAAALVMVATSPLPAQERHPTLFAPALARRPAVRDALAWLDSQFPRQVEEWIRITQIPAKSGHEAERAAYLRAELEKEGLEVRTDSMGNVIARRRGTGGGASVVFAAHMDTVHPLDTDVTVRPDVHQESAIVTADAPPPPPTRPRPIRPGDRLLRAPGVFDNSASLANMLAVVRALKRSRIQTRGDLIFVGTVQEELGLRGMDYFLERNPRIADMVVALDGGLPNVNYGALGIYWTRYYFRGTGSHTNTSAGKPHPARALAEAIRSIYQIHIPEGRGGAVYNVGVLSGGKIFNAIPEEVSFTMDLRSVNPVLLDSLDAEIEARVAAAAQAEKVSWAKEVVQRNRAAGTEEALRDRRAHPLVQTALDVHGYFGLETQAIASGSTDANAAVVRGIPAISVGRAFGGDQHTLSEWAHVDSALTATKIALLLAVSLVDTR